MVCLWALPRHSPSQVMMHFFYNENAQHACLREIAGCCQNLLPKERPMEPLGRASISRANRRDRRDA